MKNTLKFIPVLFLGLFILNSCEKDYSVKKEVEITTSVSFASDIIPILTADCATPNCHVPGGDPPELTAAKAYDELLAFGYVDTSNAEESILYKLISSTPVTMPPFPNESLTAEEVGYILAWIKQGAQNN